MVRKRIIWLVIALCLLTLAGIAGAISPPKQAPQLYVEPLEGLLRSADIGEPWQEGGLTIFPVTLRPVRSFDQVLTLDEATDRGLLTIKEIGGGEVNRVRAQNRSDRYIFLMAGEALGGAKQDRMVAEDILLPPHSKTEMAVYCVDHGRWTEGETLFRSGRYVAPARIRQMAASTKSQQTVWDSVAEVQSGARAPSGSLATVAPVVRNEIRPYREKLLPLPRARGGISGVIVARGREWVAADIFYQPSLFQRLWPKLVDSYLTDAANRAERSGHFDVGDAEEFLGQLFNPRRDPISTPGAGKRIELHASRVFGSALIKEQSVIHLEAFPGVVRVEERQQTPSLQYRRDRLEHGGTLHNPR